MLGVEPAAGLIGRAEAQVGDPGGIQLSCAPAADSRSLASGAQVGWGPTGEPSEQSTEIGTGLCVLQQHRGAYDQRGA